MKATKTFKKYSTILKPAGIIVFMIVLSLIAVNIFWSRIAKIRNEISTNQGQNTVLKDRLSTLQNIIVEAQESSSLLSFALPQSNPSVYVINHLNQLLSTYPVRIDNVSLSSRQNHNQEIVEEISKVNIDFELYGDYGNIYTVISELSKIVPIVNIDEINIESERNDEMKATIRMTAFYAPLPDKLPAITSPISDFTDNEKSTVNFLQTFKKPTLSEFITSDVTTDPEGRVNPFSDPTTGI